MLNYTWNIVKLVSFIVLSSPDSSLVWIQYMAFYLQTCQYDQARAVATRAIQRINFRLIFCHLCFPLSLLLLNWYQYTYKHSFIHYTLYNIILKLLRRLWPLKKIAAFFLRFLKCDVPFFCFLNYGRYFDFCFVFQFVKMLKLTFIKQYLNP